jgi:GNAT superfamily N-acetyltransferase
MRGFARRWNSARVTPAGPASLRAMTARQATPADAGELVRLRGMLLRTMPPTATASPTPSGWNDDWREPALQMLRKRLAETSPTLTAFVVGRPDGTGLAACVVGSVEHRLGNASNPTGRVGYVFNVVTDTDMRRRGYSRACMTALLDWYQAHGIGTVDLRASADAEPLYRSLGFARTKDPAMRLHLSV